MRRFSLGSSTDRKIVVLEVVGSKMSVVRVKPDGSSTRQETVLGSASEARAASEKVAQELRSRGYVEHDAAKTASSPTSTNGAAARRKEPASRPAPPVLEPEDDPPSSLFDDLEPVATGAVAPLARLASTPDPSASDGNLRKKSAKKKKKKKTASDPDGLDKRVLAGVGGVAVLLLGVFGYVAYDTFLKPPSIIGKWGGSMVEHEISRSLTHTAYDLVLDAKRRASMTINDGLATTGVYTLKGDRLKLALKDEDGDPIDREYKFKLGGATLDLIDPASGKLIVELIRLGDAPAGGKPKVDAKAAAELVDKDAGAADPAADRKLASVELSAKDGAFRLRHPQGWQADTGGRPDNTYSYVVLTRDPVKIQVYADIQGSLMSGSDSAGQYEEGSEMAPVHRAHELYKKVAASELSDYQEGKPGVFKGSSLGEGRFSVFKASGGLFGDDLKGYHVTLLTKDRRLSVLAYGPEGDFEKLKPVYLAVCRSLAN